MNKEAVVFPEDKYNKKFDIHIKPYLKLGEIKLIGQEMAKEEDWCDRQLILNQYLLQFCVREADEFEGMDYEELNHSGVFETIQSSINNIEDIYSYIAQATSVRKEVSDFLRAIIKLATKAEKKLPKQKEVKRAFDIFTKMQEDKEEKNAVHNE